MKRLVSNLKTFENPLPSHGGSEFEVNNWVISDFIINRLVPLVGFHPFPLNELMLMSATVCYFKPEIIFEWGTNIGKSARVFYEITEAFHIKSHIHTIDLPDEVFHNEHPKHNRGIMVKGLPRVTMHQADGLKRSFELIEKHKPNGRVLFFVDGDHNYDTVKNELLSIINQHPHALVLLHDTFYQSEPSGYNIGPYKAIQEIMTSRSKEYVQITTKMGLPGMSLIYKK